MSTYLLKGLLHSWDFVSTPFTPNIEIDDSPIEVVKIPSSNPDEAIWKLERPYPRYPSEDEVWTLDEFMRNILKKDVKKKALGYREVLARYTVETEMCTTLEKVKLANEYTWFTREKVEQMIENVAQGLVKCGARAGDRVAILMDTRYEWFVACQAIFRMGACVASLNPSVPVDEIVACLDQLESTHMILSCDLLTKVETIKRQAAKLSTLLVVDNVLDHKLEQWPLESIDNTELLPFSSFMDGSVGRTEKGYRAPKRDALALIVYTSGSTGTAKGVQFRHKDLLPGLFDLGRSTLNGMNLKHYDDERMFPSFLPCAHLFQLIYDLICFGLGFSIGFASSNTLLSTCPGLAEGTLCDLEVLKPHYMICVPIILNRIRSTFVSKLEQQGSSEIFDYFIDYKAKWNRRGKATPLVDRFLTSKIRSAFGGNLVGMMVSSAPLPRELKLFMSKAGFVMSEIYGSTESIGHGIVDIPRSAALSNGTGFPAPGSFVKLIDWPEGGYFINDLPYPRGEVIIGAKCMSYGYYKQPEKTAEEFYDQNGLRWWRSGDIAQVMPDGSFIIIDRKKYLIKLSRGVYVSLSKIESAMKFHPLVANVCVYGAPTADYLIAFIVPDEDWLRTTMQKLNDEDAKQNPKQLRRQMSGIHSDEKVTQIALEQIQSFLREKGDFSPMEIPRKVKLCSDEWTAESGLVTAALKIRRKQIADFYQDAIQKMYS